MMTNARTSPHSDYAKSWRSIHKRATVRFKNGARIDIFKQKVFLRDSINVCEKCNKWNSKLNQAAQTASNFSPTISFELSVIGGQKEQSVCMPNSRDFQLKSLRIREVPNTKIDRFKRNMYWEFKRRKFFDRWNDTGLFRFNSHVFESECYSGVFSTHCAAKLHQLFLKVSNRFRT